VPSWAAKRQNVKSESGSAADGHERAKDFLSAGEMEGLLDAMKAGRHGVRDYLLALMMYRHGLRVSEAVDLRRDEVDFDQARLWVRRLKNGPSVEQPIAGDELRAIKRYLGSRSDAVPWLFICSYVQERAGWRPGGIASPSSRHAASAAVGEDILGGDREDLHDLRIAEAGGADRFDVGFGDEPRSRTTLAAKCTAASAFASPDWPLRLRAISSGPILARFRLR
jgi:integrase